MQSINIDQNHCEKGKFVGGSFIGHFYQFSVLMGNTVNLTAMFFQTSCFWDVFTPVINNISFLPFSFSVGVARLMGKAIDRGRKFLRWIVWLASIRKRMVAITPTTHIFLLNNMAGRTVSGRRQEERCVELSNNHSACYVSMFGPCHLDDVLCSFISVLGIISMRLESVNSCPTNHAALWLVERGSNLTPESNRKIKWH